MRITTFALCVAAFALALLVAEQASLAQQGPPPPPPSGGGYGGGGGGYGPGPAPGPRDRVGLTLGGHLGIGVMHSDEGLTCIVDDRDCTATPIAGGGGVHLGFMVLPNRLAVQGELAVSSQTLDYEGFAYLTQLSYMVVGKYWIMPRLWVKGGLGGASLYVDYNDYGPSEFLDSGPAIMAGAGWEFLISPVWAADIQARVEGAGYDGLGAGLTSFIVALGLSVY